MYDFLSSAVVTIALSCIVFELLGKGAADFGYAHKLSQLCQRGPENRAGLFSRGTLANVFTAE